MPRNDRRNFVRNAAVAFNNPPCSDLLGLILGELEAGADTFIRTVAGGLLFRLDCASTGIYVARTRALGNAGFMHQSNRTRFIYVRCAH